MTITDNAPAWRDSQPPAGVRKIICRHCGLPAWLARLDPAVVRGGSRSRVLILEPIRLAGSGNVVLNREHRAVFSGRFPGEFSRHRCPGLVSTCKHCSAPVRILQQPPGSAERLAVLAPDPDPAGAVVVTPDGWAVPDREHQLAGKRYRWHEHTAGWRVCGRCGMRSWCEAGRCAACELGSVAP